MTTGPAGIVLLAVAGAFGCVLRAWVRDALLRRFFATWWSVAVINLVGAFVMGMAAGGTQALADAGGAWVPSAVLGVLAGWTTYSAFTVDVVQLVLRGQRGQAAALWAVTLLGSPALAFAGGALARTAAGGAA